MRERIMLVLDWRRRLYFYKKSYAIFIPRVAAPVATTTLGPGICTCPRPKEVVDWYTNGEATNKCTLAWFGAYRRNLSYGMQFLNYIPAFPRLFPTLFRP